MTLRLALIATFALLSACMHPPAIEAPEGVQLTPLQTISTLKARILLTLSGVDGISVEHPVDCYRMLYTSGSGNDAVRLSGLKTQTKLLRLLGKIRMAVSYYSVTINHNYHLNLFK